MEADHNALIEVFSGTLWEAEMVKSLLEDSEIKSFIKNSVLIDYAFDPIYASGVKVMILSSDEVRAKAIVDDFFNSRKKE